MRPPPLSVARPRLGLSQRSEGLATSAALPAFRRPPPAGLVPAERRIGHSTPPPRLPPPAPGWARPSGAKDWPLRESIPRVHRPNGPTVLPTNGWPVGPTRNAGAPRSPGRCPGLGERLGLRPANACGRRKKHATKTSLPLLARSRSFVQRTRRLRSYNSRVEARRSIVTRSVSEACFSVLAYALGYDISARDYAYCLYPEATLRQFLTGWRAASPSSVVSAGVAPGWARPSGAKDWPLARPSPPSAARPRLGSSQRSEGLTD